MFLCSNFLTLDVEEWFDAEIPRRKLTLSPEENTDIESQIDLYIDICNRLNIKSTCFVIGKLAQKKPQLVKKLYDNGHEIASHSYAHKLIYTMTHESFRKDLGQSIDVLENITGAKIKGFRAPTWSINASIAGWFYMVLEEKNLVYSSSVYPAKTFLYGMPEAPQHIQRIKGSSIIEIPQQLMNLGLLKIGVTGGSYLRFFPTWFISNFIKHKNKLGNNVFLYIHPWELLYKKYPVQLSFAESIIQYWGIRRNAKKMESLGRELKSSFMRMDKFAESFRD